MNRRPSFRSFNSNELEEVVSPNHTSFLGLRSFSMAPSALASPRLSDTYEKSSTLVPKGYSSQSEYGFITEMAQDEDTEDILEFISVPTCTKATTEAAMWRALSHESMGSPTSSYSNDNTIVSSPYADFDKDASETYFEQFLQKHAELLWSDVSSESSSTTAGDDIFDSETTDDYCEEEDYEPELLLLDLSASNFNTIPASILCIPDALTNIAILDLSHNVFDPNEDYLVETLYLPYLNTLTIHSCGLTTLKPLFRHLIAPKMQSIDISNHRLSGPVPRFRQYWPTIENIWATGGWFDALEANSVVDLKMLDLRNNLITRESAAKITDGLEKSTTTILV
jgi:hypothetical protein